MSGRRNRRGKRVIDVSSGEEEEDPSQASPSQASQSSPSPRQGKRRKRRVIIGSQPSEPSQSQRRRRPPQASQASRVEYFSDEEQERKSWDTMGSEEKEKIVGDLMRYVLFQHSRKLPIPKDKISKFVFKSKRMYTSEIRENATLRAKARFREIFGYEFVEMKDHANAVAAMSQSQSQRKSAPKTIYILKDGNNPAATKLSNEWDHEGCNHRGLVMIVLSLIFIAGGQISEDMMWKKLEELKLEAKFQHKSLGEIKKAIQNMGTQGYLKRIKDERATEESEDGHVKYTYKFGPRAFMETTEEKIYTFISRLVGVPRSVTILREIRKRNPSGVHMADDDVPSVPPPPPPPPPSEPSQPQAANQPRRGRSRRG